MEAAKVIRNFLPDLVTAISDCVQTVSDQCLAKGLIPESVYKRVLESGGTSEDKARTLVLAVKKSTETDSRCLEILLTILEEKLPYGIRDTLLSQIRKEISEKANTCREVVPRSGQLVHVPSEEIPRETIAIHTQLLGRLEDSIRQHERACTEKNLLEHKLKAKSEKYEKLKNDLEALKSQTKEISASIRDNMDRTQSRMSACESGITTLKTRIKELEKVIEEQDMQARRGRDTVTTQTMNVFTQFAKQETEKAVRMKEKELKLEIHERELRIRELEAKTKPQINVNPPDVLQPDNRVKLYNFLRAHKAMFTEANKVRTYKWRDLGSALEFSKEELENVDHHCKNHAKKTPAEFFGSALNLPKFEDHLMILLSQWLQRHPGDRRGSTSFATYTHLKTALLNAGLGEVARDLPPYEKIK
jgi:DNA repair exonuclease SbcCD ATPase subunit